MEQPRSFQTILQEIFPNASNQVITEVILMVEEQNPDDSFEGKVENMINLLSGEGAMGPLLDDGASVGASTSSASTTQNVLYSNLLQIYPDANPECLWTFCQEHPNASIDDAIDELNESGYVKIEKDPITIWKELADALPNADPSYLKNEAYRLALLSLQDLDDFVQNAIEKNDYPTMESYMKNKKEHDKLSIYKNQFSVDKFLQVFPNPDEAFSDPKRKKSLEEDVAESDVKYALAFLCNHYKFIRRKHIEKVFKWRKQDLIEICERLDKLKKGMRRPRPLVSEGGEDTKNVVLLQEIAYIKNRKLIKRVLKMKDERYRQAKEEARNFGLLETCQCCFDEELIPEECYFCSKDCVFCKECVRLGSENIIGKGNLRFPCLADCNSEFSLQTLQMVLPQRMFERLTQKIASEEIRQANVEGLETCPFCDFAMVLPEEEKIFKCINEECLVESCRECRHKSHVPLRCNEIEYDEDVRRRTFIENKMTEALTRTCNSCKKAFIKSNGCNKMTCSCGAKMCYLCGATISNYDHFGTGRCGLFTNDVQINLDRIRRGAQQAKDELGNVEIKFDPSVNIETFYPNQ